MKFILRESKGMPLILLMVVFILTYFIYKDFGIRMVYGYSFLLLLWLSNIFIIIFYFLFNRRTTITFSLFERAYSFLISIILINFLRTDVDIDYEVFTYILAMIISLLFVSISSLTANEINKIFKIIIFVSLVFAIYEFANIIFPNLKHIIIPHLSEFSQEKNNRLISKGFAIAIGGDIVFIDYIIMLGIATVLSLYKMTLNKRYLCIILILLFTMILVNRRSELLAAIFSIFLLYYFSMNIGKKIIILISVGVVIFVGIYLFISFLPDLKEIHFLIRYVMTVERILNGQDISSGRFELYEIAIQAFQTKPFWGVGWGNFAKLIPESFRAIHGSDVRNVHNIYLQFFTETGVVVASFIIITLLSIYTKTIAILKRLWDMRKYKASTDEINLAFRCMVFSFIIQSFFLITGFLDPVIYKLIFWFFYALAIKFASYGYATMKRVI